jgi:lysophospholipid acyltransferase
MFEVPPGSDPLKAPPTRKKRRIPRSGTPATLKAVAGLAWIVGFLIFSRWYWEGYLLQEEYLKHGFLRRVFILHMLGLTARMKYYGVWFLAEGACILAGIGYKGVDPKTGAVRWDRLSNVKPLEIELAQNSYAYLGAWNINTNYWLRNYVYLRVTPKGKKPGFRASMATFITSAFWHGFYPGYYMTFMLASFVQTIAKSKFWSLRLLTKKNSWSDLDARRLLRPFFLSPDGTRPTSNKRYYDIFSWLVTQLTFSFAAAPFLFLSISDSLKVWAQVYFYCIIGVAACLAFLASPGKRYLLTEIRKRSTVKLDRQLSSDQVRAPTLGLPDDPEHELQEMAAELNKEMELRRRKGQSVPEDLKEAAEESLRKQFGQHYKWVQDN